MCRILAKIGLRYGTNQEPRNHYSIFGTPYLSPSVCANLFFLRRCVSGFLGLEPLASQFFVSHTGRFFMPTLASPCFVFLHHCRPLNTHSPSVQLAAMNNDNHNKQSNSNIDGFHILAIIACPPSKNAFDAGNSSKHNCRDNSMLICVVLFVCWFCWNFVVGNKTTDPSLSSSR